MTLGAPQERMQPLARAHMRAEFQFDFFLDAHEVIVLECAPAALWLDRKALTTALLLALGHAATLVLADGLCALLAALLALAHRRHPGWKARLRAVERAGFALLVGLLAALLVALALHGHQAAHAHGEAARLRLEVMSTYEQEADLLTLIVRLFDVLISPDLHLSQWALQVWGLTCALWLLLVAPAAALLSAQLARLPPCRQLVAPAPPPHHPHPHPPRALRTALGQDLIAPAEREGTEMGARDGVCGDGVLPIAAAVLTAPLPAAPFAPSWAHPHDPAPLSCSWAVAPSWRHAAAGAHAETAADLIV